MLSNKNPGLLDPDTLVYTFLDADTNFNLLPINEFFSTSSFQACCSSLWNHKPPHNKSSFDQAAIPKGRGSPCQPFIFSYMIWLQEGQV